MSDPQAKPLSEEQLARLRGVLAAAVQRPEGERLPFLQERCSDDEQLRREALALLAEHDAAESFMERPLPELMGATAPERKALRPGVLLKGRYRIKDERMPGGSASVYLAEDETLRGKGVIVKVLDRVHDKAISQELFDAELESLARVRHPNVVGISDVGTLDDGSQFLVLDLVPGPTLRAMIQEGSISYRAGHAIAEGLGRGLAAAHRAGVFHLDVKPENIIVSDPESSAPHAILLDFGIAKPNVHVAQQWVGGTPSYMAPEQGEETSAKSDVYALALVAFEIFTGRLPDHAIPIEPQLPREIGSKTAQAIAKALRPDASARFPDVVAFSEALRPSTPRGPFSRVAMVGVAAATVIGGCLWFAWSQLGRTYASPVPIVSTSGVNRFPAFTPDGEYLYYAGGSDAGQGIYRLKVPGGSPEAVVVGSASDFLPTVTADGKYLLYVRGEGKLLVRRDLSDGSDVVLVRGMDINALTVAPDGKRGVVSVIVENNLQQLHAVSLGDGKTERLLIPGAPTCGLHYPQVSPDGRTLAFSCSWTQGAHDLYIVDVDESLKTIGTARRLTNHQRRISSIAWAPDGNSLFYVAGPLGEGKLYRVSIDGKGNSELVSETLEHLDTIAVPRRAWKLAYSVYLSDANLWRYDAVTGKRSRYIDGPAEDQEAYPSPDGERILFVSRRSGSQQIWTARADGKDLRQLTQMEKPDVISAIWSRDSKEAIVSVRTNANGEQIFRVPIVDSTAPTLLQEGGFANSLSRDGRRLYFKRGRGPGQSIWRIQYPDAARAELVVPGGAFGVEANDGKSVYFSKQHEGEGIWKLAFTGGSATQVVPRLHRRNLMVLGREGIFFVAPILNGRFPALFFKGFHAAEPKRLFSFDHDIGWGLGLSPDERSIYFTQVDIADSDIGLINRFR